jgi:hypothetical protein
MAGNPEPAVGERFIYEHVEYVINRITKIPPDKGPRGVTPPMPPERLQIDAMAVSEAKRRRNNLSRLLAGDDEVPRASE